MSLVSIGFFLPRVPLSSSDLYSGLHWEGWALATVKSQSRMDGDLSNLLVGRGLLWREGLQGTGAHGKGDNMT